MNFESGEAGKKQIQRDKLKQMLNGVPKSVSTWSYQRVVGYKDCAKKSESMITNSRATLEKLSDQVRQLSEYYK
jgi:hypothetical protein